MAADYAILQEIDKCMKCRGCAVACKRRKGLTAVGTADKVAVDHLTVTKSQRPNDAVPYVKYSCWHCEGAPCIPACPLGAMKKDLDTGAVYVDTSMCDPNSCSRQCVTNCRRGGYPKVGTNALGFKAYKCDMCKDRIVASKQPLCVETCPAKALTFGTKAFVTNYITANNYTNAIGDGHIYWASKNVYYDPPTTDPFIEDHISPMFSRALKSPAGKLMVIPAAVFGGLYALYRRKVELATEAEKV